jgi:hypothetical protein
MHPPVLGSAAATLAVSLIYLLWLATPDAQPRADIEHGRDSAPPSRSQPAGWVHWSEQDCATRCEIPRGHATVHWMEYLEFRRAAVAPERGRPHSDN